MTEAHDHRGQVRRWMQQSGRDFSSDQLMQLLERSMNSIWLRAYPVLGEVTLITIADRVLSNAAKQFGFLRLIRVGPKGIDTAILSTGINDIRTVEIADATELLLVELLAVLGEATAEILTPGLYATLEKVWPQRRGRKHAGSTATRLR